MYENHKFLWKRRPTWNSREIKNCKHDWYIKSKHLGFLDYKKPDTPMLKIDIVEVVDYLNEKQKKQIFKCLGDKNNKLKWGALLVVKSAFYKFEFTESSFEIFKSKKLDTFNWNEWYKKHELFFQSEYDLEQSQIKGRMILELLGKKVRENFSLFEKKLLIDLQLSNG